VARLWVQRLDAGGVVTSMQAIAQDAPGGPISQIEFKR